MQELPQFTSPESFETEAFGPLPRLEEVLKEG